MDEVGPSPLDRFVTISGHIHLPGSLPLMTWRTAVFKRDLDLGPVFTARDAVFLYRYLPVCIYSS